MAFFGKYGNLKTNALAIQNLIDLAENIKPEDLLLWDNSSSTVRQRYESLCLRYQIQGLQRVLWLNGGCPPLTWLPVLFDHTKEHNGNG